MFKRSLAGMVVLTVTALPALAQIDGQNIQGDAGANGLALLAVQDTQTSFGDSSGADQGAPFGSELDLMYGVISGGSLKLSIAGNLEANFNKMWIFLDAVPGGENVLLADNVDGGFNEIQNLAGMTFDVGFEPDHGIRLEIGSGFYGLNFFDLIDNTAGGIWGGGGPADLPAGPRTGGFNITHGWDNSNGLGVEGGFGSPPAQDPFTADTGWEIDIPLLDAFGDDSISNILVTVMISSGDGGFFSNQVLPGIGGFNNDHLGNPALVDFNDIPGSQFTKAVPEPTTLMCLVAGLTLLRRRR